MSTYVLVHGAWHGSWCWQRVRRALQMQGHEVFTPTLTGVGERSHLLSPHVNLNTHIDDVANLIKWEELSNVVLCGHSYGGAVVSALPTAFPSASARWSIWMLSFWRTARVCTTPCQPTRGICNWTPPDAMGKGGRYRLSPRKCSTLMLAIGLGRTGNAPCTR